MICSVSQTMLYLSDRSPLRVEETVSLLTEDQDIRDGSWLSFFLAVTWESHLASG